MRRDMTPDVAPADSRVEDLLRVIQEFLKELHRKLPQHEFEDVISGRKSDLSGLDLGYKPETWTEEHLIWPTLAALGIEREPQPYGPGAGWPDFELKNFGVEVIGENKAMNNVELGVNDIKEYLNKKSITAEYGIASD